MSAVRREQLDNDGVQAPAAGDALADQVARTNDTTAEVKAEHRATLDERIKRTEDRIAGRRAVLAVRAGAVSGTVRKKLSSPLLIVGAAAAGFVFAQFKRKRSRAESDDHREQVVMKPSVFASLTDALTLATTLLAMLPMIRSKAKDGVQEATGEAPPS